MFVENCGCDFERGAGSKNVINKQNIGVLKILWNWDRLEDIA